MDGEERTSLAPLWDRHSMNWTRYRREERDEEIRDRLGQRQTDRTGQNTTRTRWWHCQTLPNNTKSRANLLLYRPHPPYLFYQHRGFVARTFHRGKRDSRECCHETAEVR